MPLPRKVPDVTKEQNFAVVPLMPTRELMTLSNVSPCADPERLVRGGSYFDKFFFSKGETIQANTTISGSSSALASR